MYNDEDYSSSNSNDTNELLLNISQYKNQLDEVSKAIECANEEDKLQLQELQLNLISILELSLGQLDQLAQDSDKNEKQKSQISQVAQSSQEEKNPPNKLNDEFEKFKLEMSKLNAIEEKYNEIENEEENKNEEENENEEEKENDNSNGLEEFESSLKNLEGENVRVPFKERWGGYSYHNAVVLSVVLEENSEDAYDNPQVVVLFSQPTCLAMLPCRFFLDGRCKFDAEKCKFSHGANVTVKDLKEYKEPDCDKIVSGTNVLTLHEGQDIWHRGKVEDILEDRSGCSVNCVTCASVFEVSLESMYPLFADDEELSAQKETSSLKEYKMSEKQLEEEEESVFVPNEMWLKNSLNSKLGEWEKHTKGFGSKLMAKMGYIVGTGLGPKGEGRVDPVAAYVYPQGVSLDHCMRLREASNGEELWQVEKRLLNQQKREEEKQKQQEKYLKANTTVFDIINNKLGIKGAEVKPSTSDGSSTSSASIDVSKNVLKKNTTKELNRKNFQLSSNIEKLREEVKSLKRSRDRQSKDAATVKAIDLKLQEKMQQLSAFENAANHIESEQQSRRNMKKLCSF